MDDIEERFDYKDIIEYHMKIKNKDSDAMYELGKYYQYKKNYKAMKRYYLMGLEYGNSSCAYELGRYYYKNYKYHKAKKYLRDASTMGNRDAMDLLGDYYNFISGKTTMALEYYFKSVERGGVKSISKVAMHYFERKRFKTGLQYLKKGVDKGDLPSIFLMGKYCYSKNNIEGFIKHFTHCIKNNHRRALFIMCDYLHETKNIGKIPEYVEMFCEKGIIDISNLYLPPLIIYYIGEKVKSKNAILDPRRVNTVQVNILRKKLTESESKCCDICKRIQKCVPYGSTKFACMDCYVFDVVTRSDNRALKKSLGALSRSIKDNANKSKNRKRISARSDN